MQNEFIPAITRTIICSETKRTLSSLPPKHGGVGIQIFSSLSDQEVETFCFFTDDLQNNIANQTSHYNIYKRKLNDIRNKIKLKKREKNEIDLEEIYSKNR